MPNPFPTAEAVRRGDDQPALLDSGEAIVPKKLVTPQLISLLGRDRIAGHPSGPQSGAGVEFFFDDGGEGGFADDGVEGLGVGIGPESDDGGAGDAEGSFTAQEDIAEAIAEAAAEFGFDTESLGLEDFVGQPGQDQGFFEDLPDQFDLGLPPGQQAPGGFDIGALLATLAKAGFALSTRGIVAGAFSLGADALSSTLGLPAIASLDPDQGLTSPALDAVLGFVGDPQAAFDDFVAAGDNSPDSPPGASGSEEVPGIPAIDIPGEPALTDEALAQFFGDLTQDFTPEQQRQVVSTQQFGPGVGAQFAEGAEFDINSLIEGLSPALLSSFDPGIESDFLVPRHTNVQSRQELINPSSEGDDSTRTVNFIDGPPRTRTVFGPNEGEERTETTTEQIVGPQFVSQANAANTQRANEIGTIRGDVDANLSGVQGEADIINQIIADLGLSGQGFGSPALTALREFGQSSPINRGFDIPGRFEGVGEQLINQSLGNATDFQRGRFTTQAEDLLGGQQFADDFGQSDIEQLLARLFSQAQAPIADQLSGGNFNAAGGQIANEFLESQRGDAEIRLNEIAAGQRDLLNTDFGQIREDAIGSVNEFDLGEDFSFDPFIGRANEFRTSAEGSFGQNTTDLLGSEPLFDIAGALEAGASGQGLVSGGSGTGNTATGEPFEPGPPSDGGSGGNEALLDALSARPRTRESRGAPSTGRGRF